jgi:integrase
MTAADKTHHPESDRLLYSVPEAARPLGVGRTHMFRLIAAPTWSRRPSAPAPSQALTVSQVKDVLDTAKHDRLHALRVLGPRPAGPRPAPGELTGLRWQDTDLDTGVITVQKSRTARLSWASGAPRRSWRHVSARQAVT